MNYGYRLKKISRMGKGWCDITCYVGYSIEVFLRTIGNGRDDNV